MRLLERCDVLGRESDSLRQGTQLCCVFWVAFTRQRRLRKVVAKGGNHASTRQLREHGLRLVCLDARVGVKAIQLGQGE